MAQDFDAATELNADKGLQRARNKSEWEGAEQAFLQAGRGFVVDVNLEKFFNRVNHDILID